MKKATLILGALALVLGLSQCRKPNVPAINGIGETQHITFTSSFDNGSKLGVATDGGNMNLTWQENDKINILSPNSGQLNCISVSEDGKTGTFEGDITHVSGNIIFTVGAEPKYLEQDGGEINESKIYLVGTSEYKSDGKYENVAMQLPYAILKLDLHSLVKATGDVTITAAASAKGEAETVAKVLDVMTTSTDMYVMIPVEGTPAAKDYTFTGDAGSYTIKNKTLDSNTYFTDGGTGGTIVVAPTPKFSVSATKTVEFSKGNLYWDGSAWKFEANQWDFANAWNTNHVSHFYWSKTASVAYAQTYSDASAATDDVFFANATLSVDGETGWGTLTFDEWKYLLGIDNPCRANASSLCKWVTLQVSGKGEVKGLVILPDGDAPSTAIPDTIDEAYLSSYGAVFLPAAGYRSGTTVNNVGWSGRYWSSTSNGSSCAYRVSFDSNDVVVSSGNRNSSCCVRLVR